MKRVSILLAGLLAGCAFDDVRAPQAALGAPAHDMPLLGDVETVDTANVQRPITGSCGMEHYQHHVGQPRLSIDRLTLPANYRVVARYTRVTMEFIPERLTIRIADDDTVESMTCG